MTQAPPIGLVPRFVRDQERALEILAAMSRYVRDGKKIPRAWLGELAEIYSDEGDPDGNR